MWRGRCGFELVSTRDFESFYFLKYVNLKSMVTENTIQDENPEKKSAPNLKSYLQYLQK